MHVTLYYIPFKDKQDRRGLSELLIKRRLEKQGWEVWRGSGISLYKEYDVFPNVKRKYRKLAHLLYRHLPDQAEQLQLLNAVHHGIPDYICYRYGAFKFVECKLGYEQLNPYQKKCIPKIVRMGIPVEIHKLARPQTKTRKEIWSIVTGKRYVKEKQCKFVLTKNRVFR